MAKYMPLAGLIGVVLLMQLGAGLRHLDLLRRDRRMRSATRRRPAEAHNTQALGLMLYDEYFLLFQLAGLILLVAMIGADAAPSC
jgi:NADH-quinone oxidoreductase subunit J